MDTLVVASGGIGALGLDWQALLFHILNFAILLALLRAFAYRPILTILEQRRQTIEESLRNAVEISVTKQRLAKEREAVLTKARREAEQLVERGRERGGELIAVAEEKARERAEHVLAQAEARIANEVATVRAGLRTEALHLVATATEKIIDIKLDPAKDAELITAAVQEAVR